MVIGMNFISKKSICTSISESSHRCVEQVVLVVVSYQMKWCGMSEVEAERGDSAGTRKHLEATSKIQPCHDVRTHTLLSPIMSSLSPPFLHSYSDSAGISTSPRMCERKVDGRS